MTNTIPLLRSGNLNEGNADGQLSRKASPYQTDKHGKNGQFVFPISFFTVSGLINNAQRVIGLSGTSDNTIEMELPRRLYFEVPSSFNPKKFGTEFDETTSTGVSKERKITCRQKKENIGSVPRKIKPTDSFYIIDKSDLDRYLSAIVEDIKAVEREETERAKARPVLVFSEMTLKFKYHETEKEEQDLWEILKKHLEDNGITINPTTDRFVKEETGSFAERKKYEITDTEIQSIAAAGVVTIAPIKYARGSDIRLSLDIEKGLHIVIARSIPHKRILKQMIGRTGRMNQPGSYSAITMGALEQPDSDLRPTTEAVRKQRVAFLNAFHELSKLFMARLLKAEKIDQELCRQWLVFTAASIWGVHNISAENAKYLCGIDNVKIQQLGGKDVFI